jgi:hypothetical protein
MGGVLIRAADALGAVGRGVGVVLGEERAAAFLPTREGGVSVI